MINQSNGKSKLPLLVIGALLILVVGISVGVHVGKPKKLSLADTTKSVPMNGQKYSTF
jgi:hypothetical protein